MRLPRRCGTLGERAHEGFPVERPSMGLEEVLNRQREQRAQAFGDLLARHARAQPAGIDLGAFAEVGERVTGDDCAVALDPEHRVVRLLSGECLDSDGKPVAGRVRSCLALVLAEQPDEIGAPISSLLGGDAVCLHEVFRRIGQRRVDRHAEPLDQALRVAFMPRRGEHDRRFAAGCALFDLAGNRQRVKEQQPLPVVDRVRRDVLAPRRARLPLGVRRLPVPQARS